MHRETGSVETVIVEYGFLDSKGDDVAQLLNNWEKFAEAVVEAVCKYLGFPYSKQSTVTEPTKKQLFQVVVGTFSNEANAKAQLKEAQKHFKYAFIKKG